MSSRPLTPELRASLSEGIGRVRNYSIGAAATSLGVATEAGMAWLPTEYFLKFVAGAAVCELIRDQLNAFSEPE